MTTIAIKQTSLPPLLLRARRPSAQCGSVIGGYLRRLAGGVPQTREESSIVLCDGEELGDNATVDKS